MFQERLGVIDHVDADDVKPHLAGRWTTLDIVDTQNTSFENQMTSCLLEKQLDWSSQKKEVFYGKSVQVH